MYCAAVTKLPGPGEYQRSLSRVCLLAQPVTRVPSDSRHAAPALAKQSSCPPDELRKSETLAIGVAR